MPQTKTRGKDITLSLSDMQAAFRNYGNPGTSTKKTKGSVRKELIIISHDQFMSLMESQYKLAKENKGEMRALLNPVSKGVYLLCMNEPSRPIIRLQTVGKGMKVLQSYFDVDKTRALYHCVNHFLSWLDENNIVYYYATAQ